MSRQHFQAHYARLLRLWPVDNLRPEPLHFQRLLRARLNPAPTSPSSPSSPSPSSPPTSPASPPQPPIDDTAEINAAYHILSSTFSTHYRLSSKLLKPASDPGHYERLARELEEGPRRGWVGRAWRRLGGLVRMR